MRFHERSLNIKWKKGVKRPEKSNAIDMLCSGQVPPRSQFEVEDYERNFEEVPTPFTPEERDSWLSKLEGVVVSSDAFVSVEAMCCIVMLISRAVPLRRQCLPCCKIRCEVHCCSDWQSERWRCLRYV